MNSDQRSRRDDSGFQKIDWWAKYQRRETIGRMLLPIYALIAVALFLIVSQCNAARLEREQSGSGHTTSRKSGE